MGRPRKRRRDADPEAAALPMDAGAVTVPPFDMGLQDGFPPMGWEGLSAMSQPLQQPSLVPDYGPPANMNLVPNDTGIEQSGR
jgi:hypothetical protein